MTQTNIEQDRVDFETYCATIKHGSLELTPDEDGNYYSPTTEKAFQAWQSALKLERERQAGGEAEILTYVRFYSLQGDTHNERYEGFEVCESTEGGAIAVFTAPQQSNIPANIDELIYEHTRFNINQADDALTIKGIKLLLNAVLQAAPTPPIEPDNKVRCNKTAL